MNIIDELIKIVGKGRASNDKTILYTYSKDVSIVEGMPDYVVRPKTTEEVSAIVKLAAKNNIPIVPRGVGSGMEGGVVPVKGGIVLDMRNMDNILEFDTDNLYVVVEPGILHVTLDSKLAERGFFWPPAPASTDFATIGGMIGTNASGMTCLKYGNTRNSVLGLEVVLPDGSVIKTGSKTVKSVSGYDLTALIVGAEGTLGVVTKAILKILPKPKYKATVVAYFDDLDKVGAAVVGTFAAGIVPAACDVLDRSGIQAVNQYKPEIGLPDVEAMLFFNVEGSAAAVKEETEVVINVCEKAGAVEVKTAASKEEADALWAGRKSVASAISRLDPKKAGPNLADDYGVPLTKIPEMLRELRRISAETNIQIATYGHIGDGNLHSGMAVNMLDEEELARGKKAGDMVHEAALRLGGTATPEHGIGAFKIRWLIEEHPTSYPWMQAIKKVFDPQNIMNPGKLFEVT
ncbi:MAG: FAD-linked oxidase C-terminal domain-containing protein [Dehalococcoidia bacterium]|nr:FAD-linked oxidase C-terminal domain-containing protein [Dehalococcoidia bacterium]